MKLRKVPFSPPDITETEAEAVRDALLSGWITTGPRVKKFEEELRAYLGVSGLICLNSQTACADMALRILGIGPGDEVIVPAYTFSASASVIYHTGATIVLVDICQPSDDAGRTTCLQMDYDEMEAAITERTKAIIPVDLCGIPCDYDRIFAAVERKKSLFKPSNSIQAKLGRVAVCCDAAHAFGASIMDRKVGTIADFSSFSFHAVKNLTTAEGGALSWNLSFGEELVGGPQTILGMPVPFVAGETWNEFLYRIIHLLSQHGQNKDALSKSQAGEWEYDVIGLWGKCNLTDIAAAIGLVQLKRYPDMLERRRRLIENYDAAFAGLPVSVLDHYGAGRASSGHLYCVRLLGRTRGETNAVINEMGRRGIACNVHYKPLPMLSAYKALGFDIADYPNSRAVFENELTLPLFSKMTDEDQEYVIENFISVLKGEESDGCCLQASQEALRKTIYLCLAHMSEEGWEKKYVREAFDTNWVVPMGPNVNAFEQSLATFANASSDGTVLDRNVVCLSAGTAAVHMALLACGVGPGDEVCVQSFTFCASSHPITYLGAKPVFIGSERDTWNMDPELLEEAIMDRFEKTGRYPKAIVPVALYGMPYRADRILAVAEKYGIPVVEDAAEGLGSRYDGQVLGTFGKYGVLSFNGNKMITTSGGGALVCRSPEDAETIMWYATQAREAYPYYQHSSIGYNYRMSNVCAGIGRGQMMVLDRHIAHHRHVQALYEQLLADVSGVKVHKQPFEPQDSDPAKNRFDANFWLCAATLDPSVRIRGQENAYKEVIKTAVGGAAGVIHAVDSATTDCQPDENVEALRVWMSSKMVECRPVWKPMHRQPVYAGTDVYTNGVEEDIFKLGFCLPAGPCVSDDDVRYIVECIKEGIE